MTTAGRLLVVLTLHVALAGCSGTETGNPGGAQVELGLRASDPDVVSVGAGGSGDRVPFTVASRAPLTIVANGELFHVHAGDALLFAFDASRWLGGGILAGAPVVAGRATIDGGDSAVQFDQQTAADLFRDVNGNG